ncbi:hypothetical protein [Clostridium haemolyticum]|uniref:Uncharacterized protein n=1 Tax=Clostridium haemolyticum NCTC 9693 TaxID=1443114 RepID=A0ABR4TBS1_CLOHA|nr:hypothetical protein [Clostridium haemolyticum]KEI14020.1 hypothetical protein Z960_p0015 [Clostridium haemolyticum NCTC 9693]
MNRKIVVVKETEKAKCLILFFDDICGNRKQVNAWFPHGWLEENNKPKTWALNKKITEIKKVYNQWDLAYCGIGTSLS